VPAGLTKSAALVWNQRRVTWLSRQQIGDEKPAQCRATMADRTGLGILGCIFGSVTLAVVLMAFIVVLGHVSGSLALNASPGHIVAQQ
jgi:hypothetical protein